MPIPNEDTLKSRYDRLAETGWGAKKVDEDAAYERWRDQDIAETERGEDAQGTRG